MLELKDVSYTFKDGQKVNPVLQNINLTIHRGEFVSLIGKSGTGKSTILKLIAGLLHADHGSILLDDKPIKLGDVGYMPQHDLLFSWRTILDNILLPTEIKKQKKVKKQEAIQWLEKVGLAGYEKAYPKELSGGMRQRVAFLRTLLTGKNVLLLDEPFGALDALTKKEMQAWLLSIWQETKQTVIFITHDLEEALYLSDRVMLLHPDDDLEESPIPFERPRSRDLLYQQDFTRIRKKLEDRLRHDEN
ncbi:ATP-binding cassette domain-containing protein [Terrilactibacillus sp. BCM23-1]|uniref:ATP-binding cassette domain-containing protein n=1 Tax=Terrilactibacillus tamarindi TaxID=2599694 RepID=A0A6N8CWS6_9BACI|nr:ABC transporter ATP-binding protein [Terrilactibacillus tamarindi]MTT33206.1 ATP-binding cassette domain-containing protein [Terrilactibacillus tamarindi]